MIDSTLFFRDDPIPRYIIKLDTPGTVIPPLPSTGIEWTIPIGDAGAIVYRSHRFVIDGANIRVYTPNRFQAPRPTSGKPNWSADLPVFVRPTPGFSDYWYWSIQISVGLGRIIYSTPKVMQCPIGFLATLYNGDDGIEWLRSYQLDLSTPTPGDGKGEYSTLTIDCNSLQIVGANSDDPRPTAEHPLYTLTDPLSAPPAFVEGFHLTIASPTIIGSIAWAAGDTENQRLAAINAVLLGSWTGEPIN